MQARVSPSECLSEDDVARLVEGRLNGEPLSRVERHLDSCDDCTRVVAEVARGISGSDAAGDAAELGISALEPNARVGRYVILGTLGEGAMGRVYVAHDPELDRKVALKLLHPRTASARLEARLEREAKAMARLSHPDVIAVHDAGRHGAQIFIAMELVEGGTLRQWLAARERSWREIVAVFLRAGRGLAAAHAAGLVHRDFKPDNVLVGDDGRVRVTDFGLARAVGDDTESPHDADPGGAANDVAASLLTRTGALVGTPAYMALEQLRGNPADARSDVFSFSVALYEALFGERPFDGATVIALRTAQLEGRLRPPPRGKRVPARLRRALLVGLRAAPEARYASMTEMLQAIERASRFPRALLGVVVALGIAALAAIAFGRGAHQAPTASASSAAAATPAATTPRCSPHECSATHGDAPYACRASDGACVAIESEDCVARFEPADLKTEDTVWLGAMLPTKGSAAEAFGTMNAEGADFARREIASTTRSLDGSHASKRVRRIALVTCDDKADPARAARHLVDDVGVPAILGFGSGQTLVDLAGSILIDRRVVSVASLTTSPLITRLPQPADLPRMVWRTSYSIEDLSDVAARIVHDVLEPRLAAPGRRTRVVLARVDMAAGLWFGEAFYRRLVFNGKPAVDNGIDYQEIVIPPRSITRTQLADLADRIATAQSTMVVLMGDTGVTTPLIEAVEARSRGASRPTYVVGDNSTVELASFVGKNADRRHRVFAITSVSNDTPTARFVIRYNAAHPKPVTRNFNPAATYDAFYLLAYATFALGDAPVDGASLARVFARLMPPGRAIEVGPMSIFEGITALASGERIDLRGASMALDFDLSTGEAPSDFALVCPDVGADGSAAGDLESGVYYRAATKSIEGKVRCP